MEMCKSYAVLSRSIVAEEDVSHDLEAYRDALSGSRCSDEM
jgi:hypothetical protein